MFPVKNEHQFPLLEFLNARVPEMFTEPERTEAATFVEEIPVLGDPMHDLLQSAKNVVLEGVPGTGKSYAIEQLADGWRARTGRDLITFNGIPYAAVVMHPSSSYEDFLEGLRPRALRADDTALFDQQVESGGELVVDDGFFLRVCAQAVRSPERRIPLALIDEMNRCNVPSVLGDRSSPSKASRRARFLGSDPVWQRRLTGTPRYRCDSRIREEHSSCQTMCTSSQRPIPPTVRVAPLDAALRRRFASIALNLTSRFRPGSPPRRLAQMRLW